MPNLIPPPASLPPGSIVDIYLRDSGGPLQDRSIEQQRNEITDYCIQYGLRLRNIYADVHKSGGSIKQRDQFDSMIAVTATLALRPAGLSSGISPASLVMSINRSSIKPCCVLATSSSILLPTKSPKAHLPASSKF